MYNNTSPAYFLAPASQSTTFQVVQQRISLYYVQQYRVKFHLDSQVTATHDAQQGTRRRRDVVRTTRPQQDQEPRARLLTRVLFPDYRARNNRAVLGLTKNKKLRRVCSCADDQVPAEEPDYRARDYCRVYAPSPRAVISPPSAGSQATTSESDVMDPCLARPANLLSHCRTSTMVFKRGSIEFQLSNELPDRRPHHVFMSRTRTGSVTKFQHALTNVQTETEPKTLRPPSSRVILNSTRTRATHCVRSRETLTQQEQEPAQKPSPTSRLKPYTVLNKNRG
ncbi:hypothetical protein EXIGLDRAFT_776376 [Exidia glandulosa HHB12029]|uniref:Uncharacterized protein n=1 Tax=Exidia glandulosa HHB12029 TaxID=1314781 RepID=A0A165DI80_EXIGL|nr:hypothetical protein EXIGLDRAFT_776376 [Exidia glandulosa HHB12029]